MFCSQGALDPLGTIWGCSLIAGALIPIDGFLSGGAVLRFAVPSILALGPMFFASVILAQLLRESQNPDVAFGSNIAGAIVCGLCESFSMLLGFRCLARYSYGLFYLLTGWLSIKKTMILSASARP
jgi:hypothetical protein